MANRHRPYRSIVFTGTERDQTRAANAKQSKERAEQTVMPSERTKRRSHGGGGGSWNDVRLETETNRLERSCTVGPVEREVVIVVPHQHQS